MQFRCHTCKQAVRLGDKKQHVEADCKRLEKQITSTTSKKVEHTELGDENRKLKAALAEREDRIAKLEAELAENEGRIAKLEVSQSAPMSSAPKHQSMSSYQAQAEAPRAAPRERQAPQGAAAAGLQGFGHAPWGRTSSVPAALPQDGGAAGEAPRRAFLVNHGSFNPAHRGHVRMMELSRARLEAAGFQVDFGVLAIAESGHIRSKGIEPLTDDLRVRLIDRCLGSSASWLRGDARGVHFRSSGRMIDGAFAGEHPGLIGFSVVGADTAQRYPRSFRKNAVVVAREGYELVREDEEQLLFCAVVADTCEDRALSSLSSTAVREAMAEGDGALVAKMCGPCAAELLAASMRY